MPSTDKMPSDSLSMDEEMRHIYGDFTPLDILIAVQEFMDNINLFAYTNWIKGKIYEGPFIERYWIELTAMYSHNEMPDPSAGMRLIKRGCEVKFYEDELEVAKNVTDDDYDSRMPPEQKRTATKKKKVWKVEIKIPRHLIDNIIEKEMA